MGSIWLCLRRQAYLFSRYPLWSSVLAFPPTTLWSYQTITSKSSKNSTSQSTESNSPLSKPQSEPIWWWISTSVCNINCHRTIHLLTKITMNNIPDELPEVFSEEWFNSLNILEKALYYSRIHNLWVLPINNTIKDDRGKREPDKSPIGITSWRSYQKLKPSEEEIIKWFRSGNVNIAIFAGKTYGIVVLDIDCHSPGYDGTFIQAHDIPETWKVKSWRGGYHYYFKYPIWIEVNSKKMFDKWLEFMSDGSYLVGAWSKYIDWDKIFEYSWEPGLAPWDIELAEMPQWLIDLVKVPTWGTMEINPPKKKKDWWKFLQEIHPEWERNNTLASVAGYIFLNMPEDIWENTGIPYLLEYNKTKFTSPLPDDEAKTTILSIMSKEKRRREDEAVLRDLNPSRTGDDKKNLMGILYEELEDKIELVIDQDNHCYVVDLESPQRKLYEEWTSELIDFILVAYEKKFNRFTNQELAKNLSINMRAQAWKHWKKVITHERIAYVENENALYYDLNNSLWEVVKITEDNIEVTNDHNLYFRRPYSMGEQVRPEAWDGDFDIWEFFNISPENRKLFLCYLITLFVPHIRVPMLVLKWEMGSAKTTCFRVVKALVDPGLKFQSATISSPKDIGNLQLQLSEWYYLAYDNLSSVKGDMSDILCEAVTGGEFKNRKLYANKEMMTLSYSARIGIWSIDNVLWKDDVVDRSIIIDVPKIEWGRDFDEEEFRKKLFKYRPQILYSIFCTLWKSLGIKDQIIGLPRMSWFARHWEKISRVLWYAENEFLGLYKEHLENQRRKVKKEIIPEFLLVSVEHVLTDSNSWIDTPSKLYEVGKMLNLSMPNEVNSFCRSLYLHAENFEALWIRIARQKSGNRSIIIQRIAPETLDTSDTLDDIPEINTENNTE